jgi:transcriptional regulator with GAF, ATPase, and Fis domain
MSETSLETVAPRVLEARRVIRATPVEHCPPGVDDADLRFLLRSVADFLCAGLTWVDAASVVLGDPAGPEVLVSSSSLAQAGDGAQHRAGDGPVFDAYRQGGRVGTAALCDDERWPVLRRAAGRTAEPHVPHGCLALPLELDGATAGVVTLYHQQAGDFDVEAVADRARPYVVALQTLVRDSRLVEELVRTREQLREALTSRAVIDQAKGMVMLTQGCDAEEAFRVLVRMSNANNRKLRDVAQQIVDRAVSGRAQAVAGLSPRGADDRPGRRRRVGPRRF